LILIVRSDELLWQLIFLLGSLVGNISLAIPAAIDNGSILVIVDLCMAIAVASQFFLVLIAWISLDL